MTKRKNKIFISYRHEDSADVAGRIYDRLATEFSRDLIFKDIESIPLSIDFEDYINNILAQCDVLLVIIGQKWLSVTDDLGKRRLDDPKDLVRVEIATALKRGVSIIPLLVHGTPMPKSELLPEEIAKLPSCNGLAIKSDPDFHKDVDRLIIKLKELEAQDIETQIIEAGFSFITENTYSCGEISHTVREYKHLQTNMEFVLLPAGSFLMGSPDSDDMAYDWEKPQHKVTLEHFLMGKYMVTQRVWEAVMVNNPAQKRGEAFPVENVSWKDCRELCSRVGLQLPSEAVWEYACRAGTQTRYYWGNKINDDYCWYQNNSSSEIHPVGQKKPNAFGLYDMSGNLWEWCEDMEHTSYEKAPGDGSAWLESTSSYRVYRGGCYCYKPRHCRSAERSGNNPDNRGGILGFRACAGPFVKYSST